MTPIVQHAVVNLSDDECKTARDDIEAYNKNNKLPVIIYSPPEGVRFVRKQGKWVFGVPVWDQRTANVALERFRNLLGVYIRHNQWNDTVDMERLFHVAGLADSLYCLIKDVEDYPVAE